MVILFYMWASALAIGMVGWFVVNFDTRFMRGETWYLIDWVDRCRDIRDRAFTVAIIGWIPWQIGQAFG